MNNKLIKINLNQTISRFELAEIKKERNRWIIFSVFCGFFLLLLLFNYLILNQYHNLFSSRIEDTEKLISDTKIIRSNYENYNDGNLNLSISQGDIDRLYQIESDRISLAKKMEALAFDIPETMSLLDFDYNYTKKEMILTLISETDSVQYSQNKSELISNIKRNFFKDRDFNAYDIRPVKEKYKQQPYYKLILTLSKD